MTRERNRASGDLPRWLPHSLRRQLLLGVLAVVSVVLATVGVASVLSLRGYGTAMSDADVAESLDALSNSYTKYLQRPTRFGACTALRPSRRRCSSSRIKRRETSSPCCAMAS